MEADSASRCVLEEVTVNPVEQVFLKALTLLHVSICLFSSILTEWKDVSPSTSLNQI